MPSLPRLPRISFRRSVADGAAVGKLVPAATDSSQRKRFALRNLLRKQPVIETEQALEPATRVKQRTEADREPLQAKAQTIVSAPLRRAEASEGNSTRTSTPPANVSAANRKPEADQATPTPAARRSWLGRMLPSRKSQ